MGKVRNKKCSKIARSDPTGLEKSLEEDGDACGDLGPASTFVSTIMDQLQSHLAEERDSALNSLSTASSRQAYLEEILSSDNDIFKLVAPLLLDPSLSVRHSAAGALRNLSSISMDVCEKMIAADVLTPLFALLKNHYCNDWLPQSKEKKSKQPFKIDSATEAFVEAVTLLWNLNEVGEVAVKRFNQEKLGDTLCRFLSVETYGVRVSLAAALCLYSSTEDNPEAVTNQNQLDELLVKILMLSDDTLEAWQLLYLQSTAVGILVNLCKGDLRKSAPDRITLVMKIINQCLAVDHLKEMNKFSSDVPLTNGKHTEIYHRESESDMKNIFELDEKFDNMMALVSSQIMSLEILSNIVITDDDFNDEGDDDSGESIEEEFEEEGMGNGEEDVEMKDIYSDIPTEVYECLSSSEAVTRVLQKIKCLPENVGQILKEDETRGQKLFKKCSILRSTALICLQNLVEVLSLVDLEKCIGIPDLWAGLGATLAECESSDETMIEAITSAMRAIIQSIVNQKTLHPASSQFCIGFPLFSLVYEATTVNKIKVNIVKIIGCVGLILSRFPKDAGSTKTLNVENSLTETTQHLINCLFAIKLERSGLWIAAEILDTLFDVFAEDDYNDILKKVELIPKLRTIQQPFKKQVRSERRSLGENAPVIQTANTNLPRFIQYKEKHGAC